VWAAVTVAGAGAVTEAVAVVGAVGPGPVGLGRGGIRDGSGAARQGSHTRNLCCLRGLDSKPKQRISRRLLVRNRQHLDIA